MPRYGKSLSCTGAPTLALAVAGSNYGGIDFTNLAGLSGAFAWTWSGRGNYTITSNAKQFLGNQFVVAGPGGKLTCLDAMSHAQTLGGTFGELDTGVYSVTCGVLGLSAATPFKLSGSGTITITGNSATSLFFTGTGLDLAHTGDLNFTYAGASDRTYNFGTSRTLSNAINITGGGAGVCYLQATTEVTFTGLVTVGSPKALQFTSGVQYNFAQKPIIVGGAPNAVIIGGATLNGNLDTTGTHGFDNWVEDAGGTSSVNRDTSNQYEGTACCRMDIDASGSYARIQQFGITTIGKRYRFTCRAKASAGSATFKISSGAGDYVTFPTLTTSWQYFTAYFTAHDANFAILRAAATSLSIYIDAVTLQESNEIELFASTPGSAATLVLTGSGANAYDVVRYTDILDINVSSTNGSWWYAPGSVWHSGTGWHDLANLGIGIGYVSIGGGLG